MTKLYIVVRNDLDPGLQMAEALHALTWFMYYCSDTYREWFYGKDHKWPADPSGEQNVVILQVPDEASLSKLAYSMSHEAVELASAEHAGHITAIACSSFFDGSGENVERFVGSLPRALRQFASPLAA